jgi:hypothetical protein
MKKEVKTIKITNPIRLAAMQADVPVIRGIEIASQLKKTKPTRCQFFPEDTSTLTFGFEDGSTKEVACRVLSAQPLADAINRWKTKE